MRTSLLKQRSSRRGLLFLLLRLLGRHLAVKEGQQLDQRGVSLVRCIFVGTLESDVGLQIGDRLVVLEDGRRLRVAENRLGGDLRMQLAPAEEDKHPDHGLRIRRKKIPCNKTTRVD